MKKIILTSLALPLAFFISMAHAVNNTELEQNKQNVIAFYNATINQKDFEVASQYLGAKHIQHNPNVADGQTGVKDFINFLRANFPKAHSEIKQIFAVNDYVILHVHSIREPNTRGRAIIDIFKLENGKIVEHWDVVQDIPEHSKNSHDMF